MSDYDVDVYAWSQRQGALLRRLATGERVNDADLDWSNIAEEIETVGRTERSAVRSHIATIIEHLIKLQASPATAARLGWQATVRRARVHVAELLKDNPSLRRLINQFIAEELSAGRELAEISLAEHSETPTVDLATLAYTSEQVVGKWLPPTADGA